MFVFFFVPLIAFLGLVAPLWIIFHYITKWKSMKHQAVGEGMVAVPKEDIQKMRDSAKKLNERLSTLEKIIDHE